MKEIKNKKQSIDFRSESSAKLNHEEILKAYNKGELWAVKNEFHEWKQSREALKWYKGFRSKGLFCKERIDLAA
tara:strand:- start:269 stop:490 length:222 start_codon:yes stop_codon:yes gene_type:complete